MGYASSAPTNVPAERIETMSDFWPVVMPEQLASKPLAVQNAASFGAGLGQGTTGRVRRAAEGVPPVPATSARRRVCRFTHFMAMMPEIVPVS